MDLGAHTLIGHSYRIITSAEVRDLYHGVIHTGTTFTRTVFTRFGWTRSRYLWR
jgi:hypothetical protein